MCSAGGSHRMRRFRRRLHVIGMLHRCRAALLHERSLLLALHAWLVSRDAQAAMRPPSPCTVMLLAHHLTRFPSLSFSLPPPHFAACLPVTCTAGHASSTRRTSSRSRPPFAQGGARSAPTPTAARTVTSVILKGLTLQSAWSREHAATSGRRRRTDRARWRPSSPNVQRRVASAPSPAAVWTRGLNAS